jgi:large subunit ribosomal protein L18
MKNKVIRRQRIRHSIRKKISGTKQRPRLSVFRSNGEIYVQLIDDENRHTLLSTSTRKMKELKGTKTEKSKEIGKMLAKQAGDLGISNCVFDRGGYRYHGRVKALADGAREGGLQF